MPLSGTVFVSVSDRDKRADHPAGAAPAAARLRDRRDRGHRRGAPPQRHRGARRCCKFSDKPTADAASVVELIHRGEVDVVVNTPSGRSARADGYEIRAAAVAADMPLFTTIAELSAAVASLDAVRGGVRGDEPAGVRRSTGAAAMSA